MMDPTDWKALADERGRMLLAMSLRIEVLEAELLKAQIAAHELVAMQQLVLYLPAIATTLKVEGSDVAQKLLVWTGMLQDIINRIEEKKAQ